MAWLKFVGYFVQSHPLYYGVDKVSKKLGYNVSNEVDVNKYLEAFTNNNDLDQDKLLHPMYVMLQEQSPMGMLRDFHIKEVD